MKPSPQANYHSSETVCYRVVCYTLKGTATADSIVAIGFSTISIVANTFVAIAA